MFDTDFCKWLTWNMNESGYSRQEWLSEATGISQTTLSKLVNNKQKPSTCQIIALAYLFGDEEHIPELLEMNGYGEYSKEMKELRRMSKIRQEHKDLFQIKGLDVWWNYYEGRRDNM